MVFSSPEILSITAPRTLWNLRKSSKARSPDSDHGRSQKWWLAISEVTVTGVAVGKSRLASSRLRPTLRVHLEFSWE